MWLNSKIKDIKFTDEYISEVIPIFSHFGGGWYAGRICLEPDFIPPYVEPPFLNEEYYINYDRHTQYFKHISAVCDYIEGVIDAPSFMENPTFKKRFNYSEKHHNFCDLLPYYQCQVGCRCC
jgi:hypothetical protein